MEIDLGEPNDGDAELARAVGNIMNGWAEAQPDGLEVAQDDDNAAAVDEEEVDKAYGLAGDGSFDYACEEDYHLNMDLLSEEMEEEMERMIAEFTAEIDDDDMDLLRAFNLKLEDNLSDAAYAHLPQAFPKHHIASLKVTRKRVEFLARFQPQPLDCCINSCMCYVGPNKDLQKCRYCNKPRFNPSGKPRKRFNYIPLIPRLGALYQSPEMVEKMSYRHRRQPPKDGAFEDVFDGEIYRNLQKTKVVVGSIEQDYSFFQEETDVALGFATDGFAPFKNRKQTCWPILVYNYNLPPDIRFHHEHLICVGVIPGPKKPKDADSFLWPFVFELLELALGVKTFHKVYDRLFMLRAYPILGGGDMPAVAMLMLMKGHNGIFPCRMCKIRGLLKPGTTTHYVPLIAPRSLPIPPGHPQSYDPSNLPLRSHQEFLQDGAYAQSAPNVTQSEQRARASGIKGQPLLALLPSLFFPFSFPFDFMHLIYENVIKTLISFWCGTFKDLDHNDEAYSIDKTVWDAIGEATAAAGKTTPASYGPSVPNLTEDGVKLTADMYSFWFQYLGPVFLQKVFANRIVYQHFVKLVKLINRCLQFSILTEDLAEIRKGFIDWVQEYERIYYQFDADRLSACPVTIHALLHIADGIMLLGPVWVYWAFPMERFCGRLARFIRSRRFPFSNLDNQVLAHAQMTQIKNHYNLHTELSLTRKAGRTVNWEYQIPNLAYSKYVLVSPRQRNPAISSSLLTKIAAALVTRFSPLETTVREDLIPIRDMKELLSTFSIESWGRLRRLEGGDTMLASQLVNMDSEDRRDATFVRYEPLVDERQRSRQGPTQLCAKLQFGRLTHILLLKVPPTPILNVTEATSIAFAVIEECEKPVQHPSGLDIYFYSKTKSAEVVDITTVKALVGRVFWDNKWAIFDRNGKLEQALFAEDEDNIT
ncbi:hypothetical protein EST38_g13181 [Candolleomyces aberdarensis]|uniref:Transposase family Tnp2 protein n=1 Tax=Candolleomyces aberdarensis TaxID=2316362 RepID=A0A4Q2D2V8_9AGAR|nr:hypothetical protein EST38_g13181 [Candolleomyces aberdarensis]